MQNKFLKKYFWIIKKLTLHLSSQKKLMLMIKGYKNVSYADLSWEMDLKRQESKKSDAEIAAEVGVKSSMTIVNAFRAAQMVSDEVLTKVLKSIGAKGLVVWEEGERKYYIYEK